jgi:hypothetical protein
VDVNGVSGEAPLASRVSMPVEEFVVGGGEEIKRAG